MNCRVATCSGMTPSESPELDELDTKAFTQLPKAGVIADEAPSG